MDSPFLLYPAFLCEIVRTPCIFSTLRSIFCIEGARAQWLHTPALGVVIKATSHKYLTDDTHIT